MALLGIAFAVGLGWSQTASAEIVFHRGNGAEIESLDPAKEETIPGLNVVLDAFEGLTVYGPKGDVLPGVAEKWEISDDGKTYIFHLRTNAKWSNGDPITAQDYVYSWTRALDPKTNSPYGFYLDKVKGANAFRTGKTTDPATIGVKAIADKTLQVELENPTPYFLVMLHSPVTFAVPKATVEKYGDQWTKPEHFVGNGAYKLTEWVPHVQMTFVKNDQYWDAANVHIDKEIFYPIEEAGEELKKFRAGELDATYTVPDELHAQLKKEFKSQYHVQAYFGTYYYQFNTSKPLFNNPKLRRAMALAIDRDYIVKKVTQGGEIAAYDFVPPGVPGYKSASADFKNLTQKQRNAEAREIMKELGYSESNPLKIELLYNPAARHRAIVETLQGMWKQIYVEATPVIAEFKDVTERRKTGDFQLNRAAWIGDYIDPTTFLGNYVLDSQQNDPRYHNQEYTDLVKGSDAIANSEKRMAQLRKAEAILLRDLPVAPIYHYVNKRLVSNRISGWNANVLGYCLTRWLSKKG
jgi:oligopeptide transport system substrate-binding protein